MKINTQKIRSIYKLIISLLVLILSISWNTGCNSCNNESELKARYERGKRDGIEEGKLIGRKEGEKIGQKKGFENGKKIGKEIGYKKGKTDGLIEGEAIGYKKGERDGYKKGTCFFVKKWWKPSLGLAIVASLFTFIFFCLFFALRKPSMKLFLLLESRIGNYINQRKLEREIKITEDREKHRFILRVQELFEIADKSIPKIEDRSTLEHLKEEVKKIIQKTDIKDLDEVVNDYQKKIQQEVSKIVLKAKTDTNNTASKPKSIKSVNIKALTKGGI